MGKSKFKPRTQICTPSPSFCQKYRNPELRTLPSQRRSLGAAAGGAPSAELSPPRPAPAVAAPPLLGRPRHQSESARGGPRALGLRPAVGAARGFGDATRRGGERTRASGVLPLPRLATFSSPRPGRNYVIPEVPVPLLCGINSNGGGCSSRNNSHNSRSGSGGGGSGLPHPYPHSHLPVPGGGRRGSRQRRRRRRRLD